MRRFKNRSKGYNWGKPIAEISYVMIGILLALQVNNWNENRLDRKAEKVILHEMKVVLQKDIDDLQFNVTNLTEIINSHEIVLNHIETPIPYHDSLELHIGKVAAMVNFFGNSSVFESLKSQGVELINEDSLRAEIINYYSFHYNQITHTEKEFINPMYQNTVLPTLLENFNIDIFNKGVPVSYNNLRTNTKLLSTLKSAKSIYSIQKFRTENTLQGAEKLLPKILQKLNN